MGIGDSIRKAADNAMKDLGDNSPPADDAHAPEPANQNENVRVNSSISEGSNAMNSDQEAENPTGDEAARDSLAGDITQALDPDQADTTTDSSSPGEPGSRP